MGLWTKITGPWLIYIKLTIIAALVGIAILITRNYYEATREKAIQEATVDAVREVNRAYSMERERRLKAEAEMDGRYRDLVDAIGKINVTNTVVRETIVKETERDPRFYSQQLPKAGYQQWLKARQQIIDQQAQEEATLKQKAEALGSSVPSAPSRSSSP